MKLRTAHSTPSHIWKAKGFDAYRSEQTSDVVKIYSRKDFYKICLFTGHCLIEYADRAIEIKGTALFFGTPLVPYAWENLNKERSFTCLFTAEFLKTGNQSESLLQSPLFKIGGTPVFHLTEDQGSFVTSLFSRMIDEYGTDYLYKNDLMRNYVNLLIHEALKLQPGERRVRHSNAALRVTTLFLDLLERQFPIESPDNPLKLKNAADYALCLSVHVNHLNRAVKEITGKSTSTLIAERIITEAKSLVKHSNWTITDIAYGLGFSYPAYFNNYFKRLTDTTPTALRG